MIHIITYKIKLIYGDKAVIFWSIFYPIIMACLFYFTLGTNIEETGEENFSLSIGLTNTTDSDIRLTYYQAMLDEIEQVSYQTYEIEEARSLLNTGKLHGIVNCTDYSISITENNTETNVLKSITDIFLQNYAVLEHSSTPLSIPSEEFTKEKPLNNLNVTVVFYYALLAMSCLMSMTTGVIDGELLQANMTPVGALNNLAPVSKDKMLAAYTFTTVLFHTIYNLFFIAFMDFVLGIDFGANLWQIILICIGGCFIGTALGIFISSISKASHGIKIGISITVMLVCVFLAGMMTPDIKYLVDKNIPLLSKINPAALISDGLYALYYYETQERYLINMITLYLLGILISCISFTLARRKRYASL